MCRYGLRLSSVDGHTRKVSVDSGRALYSAACDRTKWSWPYGPGLGSDSGDKMRSPGKRFSEVESKPYNFAPKTTDLGPASLKRFPRTP